MWVYLVLALVLLLVCIYHIGAPPESINDIEGRAPVLPVAVRLRPFMGPRSCIQDNPHKWVQRLGYGAQKWKEYGEDNFNGGDEETLVRAEQDDDAKASTPASNPVVLHRPDHSTDVKLYESRGELECGRVLRLLFPNDVFEHNAQVSWNVNTFTGHLLHLDWYCAKKTLAVEFNGQQHYQLVDFAPDPTETKWQRVARLRRKLYGVRQRDRRKAQNCLANGVDLIIVPYWHENEIEKFLRSHPFIVSRLANRSIPTGFRAVNNKQTK